MYFVKEEIKQQLRDLGVRNGMNIILQLEGDCAMIIGSEKTLIDAIIEIIGYDAHLLIPSFTPQFKNFYSMGIEVTTSEIEKIKLAQEVFDVRKSLPDTRLAQQFLTYDGVIRSNHPTYSCLIWGKYARTIARKHPLHFGLGIHSPISKMYDFHAYTLTINTDKNVFFDFVASSTKCLPIHVQASPIIIRENRVEKELLEYCFDETLHPKMNDLLQQEQLITIKPVAHYEARLCSMVKTFSLLQMWIEKNLLDK